MTGYGITNQPKEIIITKQILVFLFEMLYRNERKTQGKDGANERTNR